MPLRLSCVSCQAALKITDAALIGSIVPCPKCGCLVEVRPPSSPRDVPRIVAGDADHQTQTSEDIDAGALPEPIASDSIAAPPPPPSLSEDAFEELADVGLDGWRARRRSQLAAAITAAVIVVLGTTWMWLRRPAAVAAVQPDQSGSPSRLLGERGLAPQSGSSSPLLGERGLAPQSGSPSPLLGERGLAPQSGSPSPLLGERGLGGEGMSAGIEPTARRPKNPSPPAPLSPKRGEGEKELEADLPSPKRGELDKELESDSLPAKPISQSGSPSPLLGERGLGGEGMSPAIEPTAQRPKNPSPPAPLSPKRGEGEKELEVDPLSPKRGEGEKELEANPQPQNLPPELAEFLDLLDLPGQTPEIRPAMSALAPPPPIREATDERVDPDLAAQTLPDVDFDRALAMRVAFKTPGYPLAGWTAMISAASGVPIQFDLLTIELAGGDVARPLADPAGGWGTLGERLRGLADAGGWSLQPSEGQMLLTLPAELMADRAAGALKPPDGPAVGDAVAAVVEQLAPASELGKQQWTALLHESLRRLRGQPAAIDDAVMDHWSVRVPDFAVGSTVNAAAADHWPIVSGGRGVDRMLVPDALALLIHRIARQNDAVAVFHWPDLRRRRVSPTMPVMVAPNQTAAATLDEILQPHGLQARAIDPARWWIGTAATHDRAPLVVYGRADAAMANEAAGRIRRAADAGGGYAAVLPDPASESLIVVVPRFLYRQWAVVMSR